MPKPAKGARLGSGPAHQKLLIRNLASDLITLERIRTTEAKAKMLRPHADRLVSLAKANTLHARRQALSVIEDRDVVHKLFDEVGPRFAERNGGYTRIVRLGPRKGDAAPMAIIEFVEEAEFAVTAPEEGDSGGKRRGLIRKKKGAKGATTKRARKAEPAEEEAPEEPAEQEAPEEPEASAEEDSEPKEAPGEESDGEEGK